MKTTYLFLYTELAAYTMACLTALKKQDPAAAIYVVHFPVNKEAPFVFDFSSIGTFRSIETFSSYREMEAYAVKIRPTKLICCGWINKNYIRLSNRLKNSATCILTLDNQLTRSWKQLVWKWSGALLLRHIFSFVWVPGQRQFSYALFLGFRKEQVLVDFYACDTSFFSKVGAAALSAKADAFPRVLLCVARYIPVKAYEELWDAFIQWQETAPSEWELWCVGAGEGFANRVEHPKIKHLGFLQPAEMEPILEKAGVFVLISKFEPWGVVVHEMAAAGFPLLLSAEIGAGDSFLCRENGWMIASHQRADIVDAFKKIASTPVAELIKMGHKSQELAAAISPQTWANTLLGAGPRIINQ